REAVWAFDRRALPAGEPDQFPGRCGHLCGRLAGAATDAPAGCHGLQAAALTAVARWPVRHDREVADLAGHAVRAVVELAAEYEAGADAGTHVDVKHVRMAP